MSFAEDAVVQTTEHVILHFSTNNGSLCNDVYPQLKLAIVGDTSVVVLD